MEEFLNGWTKIVSRDIEIYHKGDYKLYTYTGSNFVIVCWFTDVIFTGDYRNFKP